MKILTSSSSDEDSEEEDEDDPEEESESELLSLSDSESDEVFFLAGGLAFLAFPSEESEDSEESESDYFLAALALVEAGVDDAFCKALAASLAALASSSDQIGFSLNVASCAS